MPLFHLAPPSPNLTRPAALPPSNPPSRPAADPLRGLLEAPAPGAAPRPDPALDAPSPSLAAAFSPSDARGLLGVMQNEELAPELRRSAAEQLLALSGAPALLAAARDAGRLEALWALAAPAWGAGGGGGLGGDGWEGGGLFDLQLPAAALALLFGACARSGDALEWLVSDPGRCGAVSGPWAWPRPAALWANPQPVR